MGAALTPSIESSARAKITGVGLLQGAVEFPNVMRISVGLLWIVPVTLIPRKAAVAVSTKAALLIARVQTLITKLPTTDIALLQALTMIFIMSAFQIISATNVQIWTVTALRISTWSRC